MVKNTVYAELKYISGLNFARYIPFVSNFAEIKTNRIGGYFNED